MRNILIFMVLLISSLLYDLLLDLPLGVPMREDIRMILNKIKIIDPVIIWSVSILLVLLVLTMGFQRDRK